MAMCGCEGEREGEGESKLAKTAKHTLPAAAHSLALTTNGSGSARKR